MIKSFIKNSDVKSSILEKLPVPSNIKEVQDVDLWLSDIYDQHPRLTYLIKKDDSLKAIQKKTRNAFAPLSKVWEYMDSLRRGESLKDVDASDLAELIEQIVITVGQSVGAITYLRRKNLLNGLSRDQKKTKYLNKVLPDPNPPKRP